jgi:hypothetical protein
MKSTTFFGKLFLAGSVLALGLSGLNTSLFAQPVVDYTITGTTGDYTLDFTVNNATPGTVNQDIYFFGVYLPAATVSGSPLHYIPISYQPFSYYGVGTTLTYNDSWYDPSTSALRPGTILSGFDVLDTAATAPTSISYAAFGIDGGINYNGPGNIAPNFPATPLFEGTAIKISGNNAEGAADDGATMSLLALSLCALGGVYHKLRQA